MTFKIMTDSCCDLPYSWLEERQIQFVSMVIQVDQQEYQDDLGKTVKAEWVVEELKKGKMATTSQINIGTYLDYFSQVLEDRTPLLYLAFSSGLSGSYQNAVTALRMLEEEHGTLPIHIIDTQAASLGQGLLVLKAAEYQDQGLAIEETITRLEEEKMNLHSWVTVDDLKYLERGGRISKTTAAVGSMLKIKPLIRMNAAGKLVQVEKIRGRKKSLEKIVTMSAETIEHAAEQVIMIAYAGDLAAAELVKELVQTKLQPKEVILLPMGATIASHTGYGAMAVFSFGKKREA